MKHIVILLGIPGSGKGTQAKKICATYHFGHISTGDLLRAIDADPQADPADKAALIAMKSGKLVADEFIYRLAFAEMKKYFDNGQGVVLDGAIRNIAQAKAYQDFFVSQGMEHDIVTLEIVLDDDTAMKRMLGRARVSQGERDDDTIEIIQKRMEEQGNTAIAPLVAYYQELGILKQVDGSQTIDAVTHDIIDILSFL